MRKPAASKEVNAGFSFFIGGGKPDCGIKNSSKPYARIRGV
jgi:hypothetical protein